MLHISVGRYGALKRFNRMLTMSLVTVVGLFGPSVARAESVMYPSQFIAFQVCASSLAARNATPGMEGKVLGEPGACTQYGYSYQCVQWYIEPGEPDYHGSWIGCGSQGEQDVEFFQWKPENALQYLIPSVLGEPDCENACGNPIDASSGNKFQREVDLVLGALSFERTYNSLAAITAPSGLGIRWTHSFSSSISRFSHAGVSYADLTLPDGKGVRYRLTSGVWKSTSNVHGRLTDTRDAGGNIIGWSYSQDGIKTYNFDGNGRLVGIAGGPADQLTLSYSTGSTPNSQAPFPGLLIQVTDAFGRALVFSYDAEGRIVSLQSPSGEITYGYKNNGLLETVAYPNASERVYLYNEPTLSTASQWPAALTGIVDENGDRFASFGYDGYGRAVSTEHHDGTNRFDITYGANGSASAEDPSGATVARTFVTVNGNLLTASKVTSCAGCTTRSVSYSYDANGRVNILTDAGGVTHDFDYSATGNLTQKVEAANDATGQKRKHKTDWHASFRRPTERRTYNALDVLVQKTKWTYNSRGQLLTASQIDPIASSARTTTYLYCEAGDIGTPNSTCPVLGLLKSVDGPQTGTADTTTYIYHPADNLTGCASTGPCHRKGDLHQVVAPGGLTTTYARYDLAGRPTRVLDANGVATDLEYNARGWLTAHKVRGADDGTEVDDAITTLAYDNVGQVTKVTQPDGAFLEFSYDAAHRLTGIEDNVGNTVTYQLDGAGNRLAEETRDAGNVLKHSLSRVYDQLGQLETLADALSTPTDFTYDAAGQVDTVTDAFGRTTDNDYDPLGRLKRSIANVGGTGPERAETQFQYDALDNLTAVIDPKGLTTRYDYNGLGDLVELDSPDTGTTTYTYDAAGHRASQTDARGITATYGYDALGRLTAIDLPTAGQDIGFSYDTAPTVCAPGEIFATGRLSGFTDPSGSTAYCYDRRGNVVRKVQAVTGGISSTVGYTYSAADRLVAMTYPSGAIVTYGRDSTGRITGVTSQASAGASPVTLVSDVDYLPFGPATRLTFGNGRTLDRSYDQNYGIEAIADSAVDGVDLDYTLDAVGNVTGLAERLTGGVTATRSIDYDGLDRLEALKDGATTVQGFTYDATGNRTSKTAGSPEAYAYPTDSHRLTGTGGVARTYDAAGNTATIGAGLTLTHDDRGRLAQATGNGFVQQYDYNGRGERVVKRNGWIHDGAVFYVYDEAGRLLGEYDVYGNRLKEYVWLDDTLVAVLANHAGSTHQYVLTDHLGTPRAIVHPASNAILWRWDLTASAFGDHAANQDPDGDTVAYTFNPRYPGQYYDAETGLHYNYFRDYDPATGRYLQPDPIGLAGGMSMYGYVGGNPLSSIDPLGLCAEEPGRDCLQEALASYSTEDSLNAIVGFGVGTAVAGTGAQVLNKSATKPRTGAAGGGPSRNYTSYSRRYLGRGVGRTLGRVPVSAVAKRAGIIGAGYGAYLEHRDALFALIACLNGEDNMVASDD